ncbi:MAG TPA: phosphatase PAP2 family protein [Edaphocola sp.]|nr:phosphatase PAP2 family protein [Edaphocola sp.]
MLEKIIGWDKELFLKINTVWTNPVLDAIFPVWRAAETWLPLYLLIIAWLVYKFKWKAIPWLITVSIMILISDQLSSHLIKPLVARTRPCNDVEIGHLARRLLGYCRESYSFPSSHAVNHFCIATFLVYTLKQYWGKYVYLFLFWAFSISYGQVYVGVHFPIDIISGAVLGSTLGCIFANIFFKKIGFSGFKKIKY